MTLHNTFSLRGLMGLTLLLLAGAAFAVPPTVNSPTPDQIFNQGDTVNLNAAAAFFDAEADDLTFTASGLPANLGIDFDSGAITGTLSNDDWLNGPFYIVTVTANDGNSGTVDDVFTITVNNVNDAPTVVAAIGDQTFAEGANINGNISGVFDDIDGDTLTYTATGLPASLNVDLNSGAIAGVITNDDWLNGPVYNVTITANDGNGGSIGDSFNITIDNVNNPPTVIAATGNQTFSQGDSVNLNAAAAFDDIDGDTLTYSAAGLPANLGINLNSGAVTGTLTNDDWVNGPVYNVTVTANDGNGGSIGDSFNITVNNTNDAPAVIAPTGNQTFAEGAAVDLNAAAAFDDIDGDNLTFSATGLPASLSIRFNGANAGSITGTITNQDWLDGPVYNVTVTADDGNGGLTGDSFSITINNVNDAPTVIAPTGAQTFTQGDSVNLNAAAAFDDSDGDDLTFTAVGLPVSLAINLDSGAITGTLTNDDWLNGPVYNVTVTANDGNGGSVGDSFSFTVNNLNDAPTVIAPTPDQNPSEGDTLNLNAAAAFDDIDNDTLTYSAVGLPASLGIDLNSGAITGTLTNDDWLNGPDYSVTVTANDGNGGTVDDDFQISVINVNEAPRITGQVDLETAEDTALTIVLTNLTVEDFDSTFPDDFTLTVLASPAAIPQYTRSGPGLNTITPALDLTGVITVSVTVNDGTDDSPVFNNLQVTVTPVNDVPTFVGVVPPGLTTLEDTTLTIVLADLVINDPDNNNPGDLTLTLVTPGPADNYTLAGATAITPALNFNGILSVAATVSDLEGAGAPFLIPVDVSAVNDLPVLVAPIGPQQAVEASPFLLDIKPNFSDDDVLDTLTYTADWSPVKPPNINFDGVTGVFSGTPQLVDADPPGPIYTVIVTAADPEGEIVSDTFDLTINALGRANLNMTIDAAPATASPSEEVRWTFTTNNPVGPVAGENVQITGSFVGLGITVTAQGAVNCTLNVQAANNLTEFTCDVGQVAVGGSQQVVFSTSTSVATEIVAFGTAAGTQPVPIDPNEDDNSDLVAAGVADAFSTLPVQDLGNTSILSIAAGDVNGDGTPDIVVGTASGQPVQVYFADAPREPCNCQRDFLSVPISIPDTGANTGVALADFDGNGTLDLVIANGGDQDDVVYTNDGNGNFSPRHTLGPSNANDVAVGDFNNDGNMDIAVAASSPNLIYYGNGNGAFGNSTPLGNNDSRSVAVGRLDNNNRMDIVFANVAANSTVYTKNAGGTGFTLRAQLPIGDATAVAAGDLNGDGIDDLVFGRVATNVGDIPSNPVLINNGNGTFGVPLALLGLSPTREVLIGDVNEDGSPDLVFISSSGVHQVWVASGGTYTLHSEQIMDLDAGSGVLTNLGDADGGDPGGVDLAMGGRGNAGVGVWLNDSQGNLGLGDAVAPTLTLTGEASVSIPAKSNYVDAGATATDNIDGNISPSVIVGNSVNTSIVGSYTVTYNVQDRAGNTAVQISRSVSVTPASGGGGGGGGGALSYWLLALLLTVLALRKTTMNTSRIRGVMAVSALLLLTSVGPAKAQEIRYSWLDMSVLAQDVDRRGVQVPIPGQSVEAIASDGSGVRFRGSLGTWKNMYLLVSYGSTDIDVDAIITNEQGVFETNDEFDFTAIRSGIGVKWSIFQKTDLFAEVTYDSTDMDFGSFAGENFDADAQDIGAALGFRTMFGDHFEMKIKGRYTQVGDVDLNTFEFDDDTLYSVGFAWEVMRGFSIVGDYESGEFSSYGLGFRLDLSED